MNHVDRYTCEHVFRILDDYLDRELSPEESARVKEHLDTCAACASEHRFQAEVIRDVREKVQRIGIPSTLRARIAQALRSEESS